jgi:hypothetical protein
MALCALGEGTGSYGPMACTAFWPCCGPSGVPISGHRTKSAPRSYPGRGSSFTSELSMTMSLRPWAASAASTCSTPKRMTGHDARPRSSESGDWPGVGGAWDDVRSSRNRPRIRLPQWSGGAGGKLLSRNRQWAGLPHPPCPFVGQSLLFRPLAQFHCPIMPYNGILSIKS